MKATVTTFRSKVFKRAYEIMRNTGKTFAVCLSKAWAIYRLGKSMLKGEVKFAYEKKDGTLRKACGTLKDVSQFIKGTGKSSDKVFHYWDLEAVAFRCFSISNLITIY